MIGFKRQPESLVITEAVFPSALAPLSHPPPRPPLLLTRNTLTFQNVLITGADQVWAGGGGEMD